MARTAAGQQLTLQHRDRQLTVRAAALRDLMAIWRAVNPANLSGTVGSFAAAAAVLARARFTESAALAATYYRGLREVEGVSGTATVVTPDPPPRGEATDLVRGAALAGVINGRERGFSADAAAQNGFVKASGSMSTLVLAAARRTVTEAAAADPRSGRWTRVAGGGACDFCTSLAGQPSSEAGFAAHSHCGCTAEPQF